MTWKLFLDDVREPHKLGIVDCRIARSFTEAVNMVSAYGCPQHVYFDHDLSDEHYNGDYEQSPTGYHFAQWLVTKDMDTNGQFLPSDFTYSVHSMNPAGKERIIGLLEQYLSLRNQ